MKRKHWGRGCVWRNRSELRNFWELQNSSVGLQKSSENFRTFENFRILWTSSDMVGLSLKILTLPGWKSHTFDSEKGGRYKLKSRVQCTTTIYGHCVSQKSRRSLLLSDGSPGSCRLPMTALFMHMPSFNTSYFNPFLQNNIIPDDGLQISIVERRLKVCLLPWTI